jgi:hypothetical protein
MLRHGLGFLVLLVGLVLFENRVDAQGGVGQETDYVVTFSAIGQVNGQTVMQGNQNDDCEYDGPATLLYWSSATIKNNTNTAASFEIEWKLSKPGVETFSYAVTVSVPANGEVTWAGSEGEGYQFSVASATGNWVGSTTVTLVGGGQEGYHKYEFNEEGPGQGL